MKQLILWQEERIGWQTRATKRDVQKNVFAEATHRTTQLCSIHLIMLLQRRKNGFRQNSKWSETLIVLSG